MDFLGQSAFLQALGWATVSSFGQMALLWCCFVAASQFFRFSSVRKYILSVSAIIAGLVWFAATFAVSYQSGASFNLPVFSYRLSSSSGWLSACMTAASVTYLLLLLVPAWRLFSNWRLVRILKTQGHQRADVRYKLFIRKMAAHFNIKKPVGLYLSELVKSPVLIGFIKPVILLPVACMNHLTVQQVEAILLHELSHIRRHDYLVNIFISLASVFLYFNPFIRFFVRMAETEREYCCDQMVLQFGYDKAGYASALLTLEKTSVQTQLLAIGATGKKNLLARIEKIAGIEKKPVFSLNRLATLALALLCIFTINSIVVNQKEKTPGRKVTFNNFANPFYFISGQEANRPKKNTARKTVSEPVVIVEEKIIITKEPVPVPVREPAPREPETTPPPAVIPVKFDETGASLTRTQKERVKATLEVTKEALCTVQWMEMERAIADGMTDEEKEIARQQYLQEVNNIDWQNMENLLKAGYDEIDWEKVNSYLHNAVAKAQLASLKKVYEQVLDQIEMQPGKELLSSESMLFPDQSIEEIQKYKEGIEKDLKVIKELLAGRKVRKL